MCHGQDGKQLVPPAVPQVRLAGPLMDVVWSERHHFVACCAMDEHALPLLAFVGAKRNIQSWKLIWLSI